jgi:hypothetical protein
MTIEGEILDLCHHHEEEGKTEAGAEGEIEAGDGILDHHHHHRLAERGAMDTEAEREAFQRLQEGEGHHAPHHQKG